MSFLESARSGLTGYVGRLSSRERLLAALMALVVGLLAPLKLSDWVHSQSEALAEAKGRLASLSTNKDGAIAEAQLALVARQRRQSDAWVWRAPTSAVARLLMEQQLVVCAVQAGLSTPEVKAAEGLEVVGEMSFVRVELSAAGSWKALADVLGGLEKTGKGYVVDKASLTDEGGGPRIRLVVLMPVRIQRARP